jgi:hypothetical protein
MTEPSYTNRYYAEMKPRETKAYLRRMARRRRIMAIAIEHTPHPLSRYFTDAAIKELQDVQQRLAPFVCIPIDDTISQMHTTFQLWLDRYYDLSPLTAPFPRDVCREKCQNVFASTLQRLRTRLFNLQQLYPVLVKLLPRITPAIIHHHLLAFLR